MAGKILTENNQTSAAMDMTPMIDCVFQLIIFFMVCTEIKRSEDSTIQLPRTRYVVKDENPPKNRVVINCVWNAYGTPGSGDYHVTEDLIVRRNHFDQKSLETYLEKLDREDRVAKGMKLDKSAELSKMFVKIRADARCEWNTVRMAQMACTNAGLWQVSYGTEPATKH